MEKVQVYTENDNEIILHSFMPGVIFGANYYTYAFMIEDIILA